MIPHGLKYLVQAVVEIVHQVAHVAVDWQVVVVLYRVGKVSPSLLHLLGPGPASLWVRKDESLPEQDHDQSILSSELFHETEDICIDGDGKLNGFLIIRYCFYI